MKLRKSTLIAIVVLLLWCLLTWRLAHVIAPHPPVLYYLRIGFLLIGAIGLAGYLFLRPKQPGEAAQGWTAMANAEIDFSFSEATKQMQAAGVKNINTLSSVFILGDPGTAKTSVIAKSGLEPDLLAGYAYEEYVIAPTRSLNLWFARQTLFIDPAGAVIADPEVRKKLFKKFAPVKLKSVLGGKQPPPRSVVFTVDCDTFLQQGGGDALTAKARQFQTILGELSDELGSNFPVYVLFTKTDRLPYFREYVSNFTEAEATEIFGKTLPLHVAAERGVWAEQETKRLTEAFQDLYYTLCDRRPEQLSREHTSDQLPNVYEFPREFAKLRPLLVQFLVDLCRPRQLSTSPFLRGFYFTGVRPVSVADLAPAAITPMVEEQAYDSGATRIFSGRSSGAKMQGEAIQSGSRRVPQWVFLTHLFSDLILVDQPAMVATQGSVKLDFWRRALLAGGTALALLLSVWWIISYSSNKALVRDATAAARAVPNAGLPAGQLAPVDSLQRLAKVRETLAVLKGYQKDGTPFGFSGGLYTGNAIIEPLRTTYYSLFRKLLLSPTQQTLIALCNKPEDSSAKGYRYIYDALKAYLITTNHHEKSTPEFLTPVLLDHWQNNQQVDGERSELAKQDFEFYAGELPQENPYPKFATPDSTAVETARAYLNKFNQEEAIYASMLAAAGVGLKPIVFNDDFPESRGLIINKYPVNPAFTKKGYEAFMKLLKDPDRYFYGEEWVLGPRNAVNPADRQRILQTILDKYNADFVKTWREYLQATSFVGYGALPDMAAKLGRLTSNQSPLLEVMCVASENTSVKSKDFTDIFQPVQSMTPAPCMVKPNSPANATYMQDLLHLQSLVAQIPPKLDDPAAPAAIAQAQAGEIKGEETARNLSTNFNRDPGQPRVDEKTTAILLDPLKRLNLPNAVDPSLAAINKAAAGVCAQANPLFSKYPFNSGSKADATLEEVNQLLKPGDGKIFDKAFEKVLTRSGNTFVANPDAPGKPTAGFLAFMNRMLRMSSSFYKTGAEPNMSFSMQPVPTPDVEHVRLDIDGTTLSQDMKSPLKQTFTWPGTTPGAVIKYRVGAEFTIAEGAGLWAIWHLLDTADIWTSDQVQWNLRSGNPPKPTTGPSGQPLQVKFQLDPQGSQVFHKGAFSGPGCSPVAVVPNK